METPPAPAGVRWVASMTVSVMPSGSKTASAAYCSKGIPAALASVSASTSKPALE